MCSITACFPFVFAGPGNVPARPPAGINLRSVGEMKFMCMHDRGDVF